MPGLLGEFPRCQGLRFLLLLHPNSFPKTCHPCPFDGEGVKSALRHVFLGQPLPTVIPIGGLQLRFRCGALWDEPSFWEVEWTSWGLGSDLARHHFCCILLPKASDRAPQIQGLGKLIENAENSHCKGQGCRREWKILAIFVIYHPFLSCDGHLNKTSGACRVSRDWPVATPGAKQPQPPSCLKKVFFPGLRFLY